MTTLTALWFDKGRSNESWLLGFEAYGHAMAAAAALELQMALFIIKKKIMDIRSGEVAPMSQNDLTAFMDATRKKTFPKLIAALRRNFDLSSELIDGLEVAKSGRDSLAHDFWHTNIGFIQSEHGVDLIVKHCSLDCWHFKQVAQDLEREIGFDVDDFIELAAKSATESYSSYSKFLGEHL